MSSYGKLSQAVPWVCGNGVFYLRRITRSIVLVQCLLGLGLGTVLPCRGVAGEKGARADTSTSSPALFKRSFSAPVGKTLLGDTLGISLLRKVDIPWQPFIGLSELFHHPAVMLFHTGEAGGWHQIGVGRLQPSSVGLSLSGRVWHGLEGGTVSPEFYPPEWVESVEMLRGTEAAVFGGNALGSAFNVVEPVWRTGAVISRLWYLNAAYGVGGSSGLLVLSPHPAWEFAGGYRRVSSEGRFPNGWSNGWNAWLRFQWTPTERFTLQLSELFTHWVAGLNGGVDGRGTAQWWDEFNAHPIWDELNERFYRHDVTLTGVWRYDSTGWVLGQVWYSPVLWESHYGRLLHDSTMGAFPVDFSWQQWQAGGRVQGELRSGHELWVAGLAAFSGDSPRTPTAPAVRRRQGAGYVFHRRSILGMRVWSGGKVSIEQDQLGINGGIGASGVLLGAEWWVDVSRSVRVRQRESGKMREELLQAWGEVKWSGKWWQTGYGIVAQRLVSSVIASWLPQPSQDNGSTFALLSWGTFRYRSPLGWVELLATGLPVAERGWRSFRIIVGLGADREIGRGRVQGEVRWELLRVPAVRVSPLRWELQEIGIAQQLQHSGGELRIAARLGMAYVRLCLRDALDVPWYRMPWYPQPGRSLVFGLTWGFAD